jgi:hypothetical protein
MARILIIGRWQSGGGGSITQYSSATPVRETEGTRDLGPGVRSWLGSPDSTSEKRTFGRRFRPLAATRQSPKGQNVEIMAVACNELVAANLA